MCCEGCAIVAAVIHDSGLGAYYSNRTALPLPASAAVDPQNAEVSKVFDDELVQQTFVILDSDDVCKVHLIIQNMHCPACVWLIEKRLGLLSGVLKASVNFRTQKLTVKWNPSQAALSEIVNAIREIGYTAVPYSRTRLSETVLKQHRQLLKRVGVAGLFGMQVMVVAVALYASDFSSIEIQYEQLFRKLSLLFVLPIIFYSAAPIFLGAYRDLRQLSATMDVPIALGLSIAFAVSVYATVKGSGEIYFDSIAMFVFLQMTARLFEQNAFRKMTDQISILSSASPPYATRLRDPSNISSGETVAALRLTAGDFVFIKPGETVPADALVVSGSTELDESLLTGESTCVQRTVGEQVVGGSINIKNAIAAKVVNPSAKSALALIAEMLEHSIASKPTPTRLTDRIAAKFSAAVVALAAIVGTAWFLAGNPQWPAYMISVLVVACPCALSLAVPTAFTSAVNFTCKRGILLARPGAVQGLASANLFLFDKTGTLTENQSTLERVRTFNGFRRVDAQRIAGALAAVSDHPISNAMKRVDSGNVDLKNAEAVHGGGVTGVMDGCRYYFGSRDFIDQCIEGDCLPCSPEQKGLVAYLSDDTRILASFHFSNPLRSGARQLIDYLKRSEADIAMVTGDRKTEAKRIAKQLGIDEVHWRKTPSDKLDLIHRYQQQGACVAMVGDGINDAPTLAAADVSVAPANAQHIARANADIVLLDSQFSVLAAARDVSKFTVRIMKTNITWAITYNLVGICLAAAGYVPPIAAAIGMSVSSLAVVGNSLRIMSYRIRSG